MKRVQDQCFAFQTVKSAFHELGFNVKRPGEFVNWSSRFKRIISFYYLIVGIVFFYRHPQMKMPSHP